MRLVIASPNTPAIASRLVEGSGMVAIYALCKEAAQVYACRARRRWMARPTAPVERSRAVDGSGTTATFVDSASSRIPERITGPPVNDV
jgi:hypothetical protein